MAIQAADYDPALKAGAELDTANIGVGEIVTADLADDAVTTAKINADAVTNSEIADNAVSLENLDSGITPSHIVVYAGEDTWTGGGASKAITVTGAAATDIVVATIQSAPSEAAYIASAAVTANTVTITLSAANTSNDAVISYQVLRAAA